MLLDPITCVFIAVFTCKHTVKFILLNQKDHTSHGQIVLISTEDSTAVLKKYPAVISHKQGCCTLIYMRCMECIGRVCKYPRKFD